MALFDCYVHSESLRRKVSFQVILPNDPQDYHTEGNQHYHRPTKVLYLLHGYSDSSKDWLLHGEVQRLAFKYNLAIVLPEGGNNFYLDQKGTGHAYETFVGKELPAYIGKTFALSQKTTDQLIGGYSMGGYGAIHIGLNHVTTFGHIIALSSALIVSELADMEEGYENAIANYDYYKRVFGDFKDINKTHINPEFQVKKILDDKGMTPDIYLACGTDDFLIEHNRNFQKFLKDQAYPHIYQEGMGGHNWEFWNHNLEKGLEHILT